MKNYLKELIILIIQIITFYLLPLFMKQDNVIGMILLMIIITFILSILIANISNSKLKYLYPIITSIIFIPTVYIYYNTSALIHSIWYLIISIIGILIGIIIKKVYEK